MKERRGRLGHRRHPDTETKNRNEGHVTTEAEIEELLCKPRNTKDGLELPEAGRIKEE